jgi:hydroxymethylglutaryl-CoA reductase (NADPH)
LFAQIQDFDRLNSFVYYLANNSKKQFLLFCMISSFFATINYTMSFFQKQNPADSDLEAIEDRQKQLQKNWKKDQFSNLFTVSEALSHANHHNCENMIGVVSVPVGLAGPVKITVGDDEASEYVLPLATSEGALVASVNRGLKAINLASGAQVFVKNVGMTRAPVFAFKNGQQAFAFAKYLAEPEVLGKIKQITQSTSTHLQFQNLQSFVRGRNVYVRFSFLTGEAMGMNMATIALAKLWTDFLSHYDGGKIEMLAISSNVCTDKKAAFINQLLGRGYSVQAEVFLSETVLQDVLKTSVTALLQTHLSKNLRGSNLAGSTSHNMQFANVAAAFYLATGQDLAHVTEASQGETIVEVADGGVYFAVNLPDLPLGTVGGGTNLPAQKEVRSLIRQDEQEINPARLAALLAVGVLAAEISGLAALSSQSLAAAHARLAR